MVFAVRKIREHGFRTAALTNNWVSEDQNSKMDLLRVEFDVFVEMSSSRRSSSWSASWAKRCVSSLLGGGRWSREVGAQLLRLGAGGLSEL